MFYRAPELRRPRHGQSASGRRRASAHLRRRAHRLPVHPRLPPRRRRAESSSWSPAPTAGSCARPQARPPCIEPGQEQDYAAAHAPDGFELVIDAAGPPSVVPTAMAVAAAGARILLFGQQTQGARAEIEPQLANEKELTILGSYAAGNVMCETVRLLEHPGLDGREADIPPATAGTGPGGLPADGRRAKPEGDGLPVGARGPGLVYLAAPIQGA